MKYLRTLKSVMSCSVLFQYLLYIVVIHLQPYNCFLAFIGRRSGLKFDDWGWASYGVNGHCPLVPSFQPSSRTQQSMWIMRNGCIVLIFLLSCWRFYILKCLFPSKSFINAGRRWSELRQKMGIEYSHTDSRGLVWTTIWSTLYVRVFIHNWSI